MYASFKMVRNNIIFCYKWLNFDNQNDQDERNLGSPLEWNSSPPWYKICSKIERKYNENKGITKVENKNLDSKAGS